KQQRIAPDRHPALAGAMPRHELNGRDPENAASARNQLARVEKKELLAAKRRDENATALGQVRSQRLQVVDELGKQIARKRLEAGEHQLVGPEGRAVVVVRIAARALAPGARDGGVGLARGHLAACSREELLALLVHRAEATPFSAARGGVAHAALG